MAFAIPESTIEEIKVRTDLADLIAVYGIQVKRAGGSYKACCPFHHEKTPSFHIQPAKGFYHCFGCGESGDAIKFVMKYEGLTFTEAAKKLAAAANIAIEEKADPQAAVRKRQLTLHAELAAFYQRCLKAAKEAERARAYLASRNLNDDVVERFQIGYAPLRAEAMLAWAEKNGFSAEELETAGVLRPPRYQGGRWYSPFAGRVMFSIRDRSGRVIAFSGRTLETDKAKMRGGKYVNSPETPIFRKSDVLYAFDIAAGKIANARPVREAIVCEGQIDVIRCHACGFDRAIASQGTAFTAEHVKILNKVADAAVLVFDGDSAGRKAAVRTGGEMLAVGMAVRVARLPPEDDPDSLLRTKGADAFQACLDSAESLVAFQVRIALEAESNPESYDAISRAGRAVLDLVKRCPSAVMRAGLLREASSLLKIPVSALEEDLIKVKEPGDIRAPVRPKPADGVAPKDAPPPSEDAAAPENNPPPNAEIVLMELLSGASGDVQIANLLESFAPDVLFAHNLTRLFVKSYVMDAHGETEAARKLLSGLPRHEQELLERIYLADNRAGYSELEPAENVRKSLRSLWSGAVRRVLGSLPVNGDAQLEKRRIGLSIAVKKFKIASWHVASSFMTPSTLQ